MIGKNVVVIQLKRPLADQRASGLEPPIKALPLPYIVTPKSEPKKQPPKEKQGKSVPNKLRIGGKTYKVGDFAYVTERKCIARIDEIYFPTEESKSTLIDITWHFF